MKVGTEQLQRLAAAAWQVRGYARIVGDTKVGAAVLALDGQTHVGCNVEHRFRCHDVHAEVNAITSMTAAGGSRLVAVVIAASRERFTPCGGCMDWIMELGGPETIVCFQSAPEGPMVCHTADELMPHYPG